MEPEYKKLDLTQTVYNLCKENPGLDEVLKLAGFTEITNPLMRNTAGRVVTLEKGMQMKKIDAEHLKKVLNEHGYTI